MCMIENPSSINSKISALNLNRSDISKRYGLSRSAFYSNIKRYDEGSYDRIAPGLLSFFRFVDKKAQTKNDVQAFISDVITYDGGFLSPMQPGFLSDCLGSLAAHASNPFSIFDAELSMGLLQSNSAANEATDRLLDRYSPGMVSKGKDGEYTLRYGPLDEGGGMRSKFATALAMMLTIAELSKEPALSDLDLDDLAKAKDYIKRTVNDLMYIVGGGRISDENMLLSRLAECNRYPGDGVPPRENWFVLAFISDPEGSESEGIELFTTRIVASSTEDAETIAESQIRERGLDYDDPHHIFGPYPIPSTAENVRRYLVSDWLVNFSPEGMPPDAKTAEDWLSDKVQCKAIRRGLD